MICLDYLSRQPYLELLKSIIANQKDNPTGYSFAIDGEWGAGKTWILRELEKQLLEEEDNKYLIFHYNAWENDFYDEPLVAILSVMIECLKKQKTKVKEKDSAKKVVTSSINALTKVVGTIIEQKWKVNPNDIIESVKDSGKAIGNIKLTKSDFNNMLPLENALKQIKEVITKVTKELHIIFIIDELDRCLPEYAIKVLERLHHICNEMPVIQILAINKNHLAESICKVFGKQFYNSQYLFEQTNQFAESYLQKFVDAVIPLPNGHPISQLEILNGLETKFNSYIRPDTIGRPFINLDENFLAECISSIMNGVERRLQEKLFKLVALCHELTIKSGVKIEEKRMTYAFLIYEILSCISKYVFHSNGTFKVRETLNKSKLELSFYQVYGLSKTVYESEYDIMNSNIERFFSIPKTQTNQSSDSAFIRDTKSYIMAFFTNKPNFPYWTFESSVWDWIAEDKVFLKKYDEIMDMLIRK